MSQIVRRGKLVNEERPRRRRFAIWLGLLLIAGGLTLTFLSARSRPPAHALQTPFIEEVNGIRLICLRFLVYIDAHPTLTGKDFVGKSLADLVTMGVVSPDDANYLRDHQVKFYGFDPDHRDGNTPIFEAEYPATDPEKRIVAYCDGRIATSDLKKQPFHLSFP
jgi:hypothetical protein